MPGDGDIHWNEPNLRHLTQDWSGPTGVFIDKKSQQLAALARISAGFDTGALIAAIDVNHSSAPNGDLEAKVGANPHADLGVGYALFHHEGTKPHEIRAKRRGGVLRFRSRGIVVFARRVWHPGTTPVKYLTRWLKDVI